MDSKLTLLASTLILPLASCSSEVVERPNILWLTFEDTSASAFRLYGNRFTTTPTIDSLAAKSVLYTSAYSCGPQSSAARSTLITGCYAPTYAMEYHRAKVATPDKIFYPDFLREAGYFCTNNEKTDYNSARNPRECWDECSLTATYNSPNRKEGQPFFAVFNSHKTHMSRFTSTHLDDRRDFALEGLDPAKLDLPAHVPDLEAMRSDYAFHLEGVNDLDKWVKIFLDDLREKGLDDNTIIFFFSDHGGCLPRGKGYQYESSYAVPFFVYLPEKWQHLSKTPAGGSTDRLVSFADFAPTLFSIIGAEIPSHMQGLPFLGEKDTAEREYQFGVAGNQAHHFLASRTVSDGKIKYIRRFVPYKSNTLLNEFQWQMPANLFWDKAYYESKNPSALLRSTFEIDDAELLYDLTTDPDETHNLLADPAYKEKLDELRGVLADHMRSTKDLGLFPAELRSRETPIYTTVRESGYDLEALYSLAELTASVQPSDIPMLRETLAGEDETMKYWAAVNCAVLARNGQMKSAPQELIDMLTSEVKDSVIESGYALYFTDARAKLYDHIARDVEGSFFLLELMSYSKGMWRDLPASIKSEIRKVGDLPCATITNGASPDEILSGSNVKIKRQDNVVQARRILVNVGEIPAEQLYSGEAYYNAGLKVNRDRRAILPLPYNN